MNINEMTAEQLALFSPEQIEALAKLAEAQNKKAGGRNPDFQGVWRKKGKDYGASIVQIPKEVLDAAVEHDGKVWINIFNNKKWEKKEEKEAPLFDITFNSYKPKKS